MHEKFSALINNHTEELQKHASTHNIIGYAKLSLLAFIALATYLAFRNSFAIIFILLLIVSLAITIILWIYHAKLSNKIAYIKGIISINNNHLSRINGQWVNFKDTGAEFIDARHPYSSDLDIIGQKSLFQFLNTTHTWHGRQAFASDLLRPKYEKQEIKTRQEAIAELSQDIEFSSKIQYYLSKIGIDPSMPNLIKGIKNSTVFMQSKIFRALLTYIPVLTLLFIVGTVIFRQTHLYIVGLAIAAVQLVIWACGSSKTREYLSPISKLPYKLGTYGTVIEMLTARNFASQKLASSQKTLKEAKTAVKELNKIVDKLNIQHNIILYFLANIFLLWDYHCAFLLQEWKQKYAHVAEDWFLAIGEFESLLSFSHLPNVCSNANLPMVYGNSRAVSAKSIGHPLLSNESRVNNDFRLHESIFIVSGSNMSGKTTFLRTVGINIVLARTGGFVCAAEMQLPVLDVATSMRLADDLNEGVSTFYAELKRIKAVLELAEAEPNMIFLIDEIFRGTNSVDRLAGAKGVITKLDSINAIGLLSTHDLELCELENAHKRVKNYSFCEHYKDSKLLFDYQIKNGKSKTTNARYLMEMLGIVSAQPPASS